MSEKLDYKSSGVDVVAGENAVKAIKGLVRTSYNNNVLSDLGSFGGLYNIDLETWNKPVLVSSTDGVGTKLLVAIMSGVYDTVGQDLVNHCVNDILVQGALPQFMLDYIGLASMDPDKVQSIISGLVKACRENGCALIGGEMAEMPGIYHAQDFDLVGTIVGMVERDALLPRQVNPGDLVLGFPSSGLHTNGFSLARKILFEKMALKVDSYIPDYGKPLGEILLSVHLSYLSTLKMYLKDPGLHALAHITGGGIHGNLKRVMPSGTQALISLDPHRIPPLFKLMQEGGEIDTDVMRQAFNLGVGMIAVVDSSLASRLLAETNAFMLGEVQATSEDIRVRYL